MDRQAYEDEGCRRGCRSAVLYALSFLFMSKAL